MNKTSYALSLLATLALGGGIAGCKTSPAPSTESVSEATQAISEDDCPTGVPTALAPAADQTLKSTFTGEGVQIYICNATSTGFGWTFVAPQANLLNDDGNLVGTHFIGPTWQGNDGTAVVGKKAAGVTVDPTAIPWLLLTAVSHTGTGGRFGDVTSIQRLSTVGGVAPASGCDAAHLGTIAQVPYSAQYFFYETKEEGRVKQCGSSQ
jgi:hypothetical protein